MAKKYAGLASSRSEYARVLPNAKGGFRGVDLSHAPHQCEPYRASEIRNMWRDYRTDEGGALETIPGFRCLHSFAGGRVNGIHHFTHGGGSFLAVHAGERLYVCPESEKDLGGFVAADGSLADAHSRSFVYNGTLYLMDGKTFSHLTKSDGGFTVSAVSQNAYVPKTFLHGEELEQRNMLTDRYLVAEQGGNGVEVTEQVPKSAFDVGELGSSIYIGKDSFVMDSFPTGDGEREISAYADTAARCLVVTGDIGRESAAAQGRLQNLESIVFSPGENGYIYVHKRAPALPGLRRIYFCNKGTYVRFDEEFSFNMPNGGEIFFCDDSLDAFAVKEETDEVSGVHDFLKNVLLALPPNIIIAQGECVFLEEEFSIKDDGCSFSSDCVSNNNGRHVILRRGKLQTDESGYPDIWHDKIYLHNAYEKDEDGKISSYDTRLAFTVGKDVPFGRYYFYGNLEDDYGNISPVKCFCIDVVDPAFEKRPVPVRYVFGYDARPMRFELPERSREVHGVKDGEFDAGFGCFYDNDGLICAVGAMVRAEENEVKISATADDYNFRASPLVAENAGYKGTSEDAINGCTLGCIFDDRVFLTGNKDLPNTIFYSQRNDTGVNDPTYFGVLNYVNDGTGASAITAIFSFSDTLCVTKRDAVYYHQGADGGDLVTRIYPSVRGNTGLGSLGAVCCFLDDPVMLTREGVWGINKETLTLERTLGRRSATVDARLLQEGALDGAQMVEWEGYLCLFVEGNVYMADSRATYTDAQGGVQYEWFLLSHVGVWKQGGRQIPIYLSQSGALCVDGEEIEGREIEAYDGRRYPITGSDEEIRATEREVYTAMLTLASGDAVEVPYLLRDGKAIVMMRTEERENAGDFLPAVHPAVIGGLLYFGNEDGELFVFNTDKRGVAVGEEEMPIGAIHRSFYSFAGHRIDSGFATRADDCDAPHLCKTTSPRSLTIRAKLLDHMGCRVSVVTERNRVDCDRLDAPPFSFGALDFTSVSFYTGKNAVIVGKEKEKRWVEKQYVFRDGGFQRPFGVYSVAYRYRIAGRIRE